MDWKLYILNLICRPKKVLYNSPDTEIECTIYKYSSEPDYIDELYVAIGKYKNYWVVFNDKLSANKTVEKINSRKSQK